MFYNKTLLHHKSLTPNLLFNYLTILLAFTIPFSIAGYNTIAGLLLITWIWEGNWQHKWYLIKQQKVFVWLLLFFSYYSLTLLWSDNTSVGLDALRKYYLFLLLPMLYTSLRPIFFIRVLHVFLSAMVISEILSYLIFFELMPYQNIFYWYPTNPSPFMSRGVYSVFLAFAIFLMITNLFNKKHTLIKTGIYLLFITTMLGNLFINAGRTGQFALAVGILVFLLDHFRFNIFKTLSFTIIACLIIFTVAFNLSPNFHLRSIETWNSIAYLFSHGTPLTDSAGFRIMAWQTAIEIFLHQPLLGVGIGDAQTAYQTALMSSFPQYHDYIIGLSDFHNTYLQIAVNGGGVALLLWCIFLYSLFTSLNEDRMYHSTGVLMLTLLTLYMMVGNLPAAYLTILFVLIMGITMKRTNLPSQINTADYTLER